MWYSCDCTEWPICLTCQAFKFYGPNLLIGICAKCMLSKAQTSHWGWLNMTELPDGWGQRWRGPVFGLDCSFSEGKGNSCAFPQGPPEAGCSPFPGLVSEASCRARSIQSSLHKHALYSPCNLWSFSSQLYYIPMVFAPISITMWFSLQISPKSCFLQWSLLGLCTPRCSSSSCAHWFLLMACHPGIHHTLPWTTVNGGCLLSILDHDLLSLQHMECALDEGMYMTSPMLPVTQMGSRA